MQIPALLDLEQFPDSPYADELRRGFPDLPFSAALEKDFQSFHLDRVRSRVRFFQLATCLLSLAVAIHLVVLDGMSVHSVLVGWLGLVESFLRAPLSARGACRATAARSGLGCRDRMPDSRRASRSFLLPYVIQHRALLS